MWYGTFAILAALTGFIAGGSGNVALFAVSIILFAAAIVASVFEVKGDPAWLAGLSFALIWLGGMGGVSWPILRWPLAIPGLIVALVYLLVPRK